MTKADDHLSHRLRIISHPSKIMFGNDLVFVIRQPDQLLLYFSSLKHSHMLSEPNKSDIIKY